MQEIPPLIFTAKELILFIKWSLKMKYSGKIYAGGSPFAPPDPLSPLPCRTMPKKAYLYSLQFLVSHTLALSGFGQWEELIRDWGLEERRIGVSSSPYSLS